MALEVIMIKGLSGTLHPATDEDAEKLASMKVGTAVKVTITQFHNVKLHRKLFVLFRLAYDLWNPYPVQYNGQSVGKTFDQFREDLTILAGHYTCAASLDGSVRLTAKSLSFARMDTDAKSQVYRDVLNVVWDRVLKSTAYRSIEEVEQAVERLIGFD